MWESIGASGVCQRFTRRETGHRPRPRLFPPGVNAAGRGAVILGAAFQSPSLTSPAVNRLLMSAAARAVDDGRTEVEIGDVATALLAGEEPPAAT